MIAKLSFGMSGRRRAASTLRRHAIALATALLSVAASSSAPAYTFKVLHSFCGQNNCSDGAVPYSGVIADPAGNLFGTTIGGGHGGTAYEVVPNADRSMWTHKVLYDFCTAAGCPDGYAPGALIRDTAGNLYGTTQLGGSHDNAGTVFKLSPNSDGSWTFALLYTFCSQENCADGGFSAGGLTYSGATSGNAYDGVSPLYVATLVGGAGQNGAVIELDPPHGRNGWTEKVIYSLCSQGGSTCPDGRGPGPVVLDDRGVFYGATQSGGSTYDGLVYALTPNVDKTAWTQTTLHNFCSLKRCKDGDSPVGGLTLDMSGHVYGNSPDGGKRCSRGHFCGTIFRTALKHATAKFNVIYTFCRSDCSDGQTPYGDMIIDPSGTIFGTTVSGGGNIYSYSLNGALQVLHNFCSLSACADGQFPYGQLFMDSAGNIFGTTSEGGEHGYGGTVYELTP